MVVILADFDLLVSPKNQGSGPLAITSSASLLLVASFNSFSSQNKYECVPPNKWHTVSSNDEIFETELELNYVRQLEFPQELIIYWATVVLGPTVLYVRSRNLRFEARRSCSALLYLWKRMRGGAGPGRMKSLKLICWFEHRPY